MKKSSDSDDGQSLPGIIADIDHALFSAFAVAYNDPSAFQVNLVQAKTCDLVTRSPQRSISMNIA